MERLHKAMPISKKAVVKKPKVAKVELMQKYLGSDFMADTKE